MTSTTSIVAAGAPGLGTGTEGPSNGLPQPFSALRKTFRDGYRAADLRADVLAGLVVGVVALPLSMALAIASGVPPQHGLYTAIVGGAVIALLGGSRVQVSGPTAAFVVILMPISARFGLGGLLVATMMAGVILMLMGLARLGRLIEFVPYPVTTGFTAGIAVVIATLQVKDLLGLTVATRPDAVWIERTATLVRALSTVRPADLAVGVFTLGLLLAWPRLTRRVPAPLVALTAAAGLALLLRRLDPALGVATINGRFHFELNGVMHAGIPRALPAFGLPWRLPGPTGEQLGLSLATLRDLAPSAFAIAMLGAIESLLSAVVADGMIRRKHDPNAELMAQGTGNVLAPLFGGIAATGAIARTATNVRSGGRSPIAAVVHSAVVLTALFALAPLLGYVPMAALAALLLVVSWNMGEPGHVWRMVRTSPRADVLIMLTCFSLTVVFDMVVSVTTGVALAALLFMKRMAEVSNMTLVAEPHRVLRRELPPDTVLYEVVGPLFFGAAQKAMSALQSVQHDVRVVILDVRSVPAIDATGLVNLESAVARLLAGGVRVVIAGAQRQPLAALTRAGWTDRADVRVEPDFDAAIDHAQTWSTAALPASART